MAGNRVITGLLGRGIAPPQSKIISPGYPSFMTLDSHKRPYPTALQAAGFAEVIASIDKCPLWITKQDLQTSGLWVLSPVVEALDSSG